MKETVLLVDDEEAIREIMSLSLADLGYPVLTAANGEAALAVFEANTPGIVLTDIKMPVMDGVELLRRLKEKHPDVEVVMISGHGDMDLAIKSLQHGALDFITKPVREELLINALKRATERIGMRRQIREHTENLERIVKEKSAKLVELERQIAVGQVVEGLGAVMRTLVSSFDEGPSYFNELPCFIAVHNRYLEIVAANQLHRDRLGDMVGRNSWEAYQGHEASSNACPVVKTIGEGKGQRSNEVLLGRAGQAIPVIVHTAPIFNQKREVELIIEISVDVTEVNRIQEELRAVREKYQRLFDAVPSYISVLDRDLNLVEANRRYRADFGEPRSARCHELFAHRGEPCEHCPAEATLADGTPRRLETVVTTREGVQLNVLIQTAPIFGESGGIEQVLEIAADITEIRALQDHLASLGLMLGSMSHGVKGLLTALDGGVLKVNAGLRRADQDKLAEGWAIVSDKIARIRKMVLDILYYAKSREPELAPVDVARFAADVAAIVEPKARGKGVDFVARIDAAVGEALLDEASLSPALVNFLENSVDACAEDRAKTAHEIVFSAGLRGEAIVFTIRDNGVGMDQDTREKMFSLFFSSKGSKGTGLGLFISNQAVRRHGGVIEVESAPGAGSTIAVVLPRRLNPNQGV
ncbi:MAG: response regulator [Desulfovibrionaceae bacterium]|nr:response regulator [Desulfovibrionaceae bacterium]MBF0513389.1 response regulator [Desulfovibrionaceae bacterium]